MKNYYELLSVAGDADRDEIKRAFRREIARYHPDKVSHLGPEFLQIAESRAAELTQAYRTLSDPAARAHYDDQLRDGIAEPPPAAVPHEPTPVRPEEPRPDAPPSSHTPPPRRGFEEERATRDQFLRRAALTRFRVAVRAAVGTSDSSPSPGFDAGFVVRPRRGLFGRAEPGALVVARFVPTVDGAAVDETWTRAARLPSDAGSPAIFLMGSGLAPRAELAARIGELRRKSRGAPPLVVPIDVRDWDALVPTEAPPSVRAIIEKLRNPD